jgi:uncharacterized protein
MHAGDLPRAAAAPRILHRRPAAVAPAAARSDTIRLFLRAKAQSIVKFHLSTASGNVVTGVGPGWVRVGATEYRENLVLTSADVVTGWAAAGFDGLADADFAAVLAHKPEVVLFGAGPTIRFPHPRLLRALTDGGIGVEVMDTPAACRTFNILAAESRSVVAALLLR